jgi:hypothetical protein
MFAAVAMVGLAVTGCGLTQDVEPTPSASGSLAAPAPSVRPSIHAVPDAPAGISDVWFPADFFVVSIVLAVSENGDALVAFADDPGAWANGISSFGIATVTPDGVIRRLVEPGSILTEGRMPLVGSLSETSAVIVLDGATPQDYVQYFLIDSDTGASELSGETFVGPHGVVQEMRPSTNFLLIDDTIVWTQITEMTVGGLVSLSLDDGASVHSGDDPLLDSVLNDVLTLGRDYCTDRGFWIYGYELGTKGPWITASATLGVDGVVSIDQASLVPAAEFSRPPFVARCGESVLGSLGGKPVDGHVPLLLATPATAAGVPVGADADGLDAMAITRDWLVLSAGSPMLTGHSLVTLVNRHDDNSTAIEADGLCAILSPVVAGSTIAWATGALDDANLKTPLREACTVAVGTLASP